ncbi:MAG: 3-isopropylmalate dehydrogenase [Candidatus Tectomicrobia bacterium]|nr:3-isopropylmalate dehydrogenase [Candidatus Tectomicrobia bacterium]
MSLIAVLPGDGIGVEVTREARRVLEVGARRFGFKLSFEEAPVGGAAYEACGEPLPAATLDLARRSAAVLFGAVGGPSWEGLPRQKRPEAALLGLRKGLGVYANLRPAKLYPALAGASTLKPEVVAGLDIMVVRELTGGIYFGEPRGVATRDGEEEAWNTLRYTKSEIIRIARMAFEIARRRRRRLTSVDKANILEVMELWRRTTTEVAREYPDVAFAHMLVDTCAMQLVSNPKQFDVIVTGNMFGDILSDEAAQLTGSIGMLPSASLGGTVGFYEPVHGSAPDIAGQDKANPIAAIASAAMLLRYSLHQEAAAQAVEEAIGAVLGQSVRTADIAQPGCRVVGTREMGERICAALAG